MKPILVGLLLAFPAVAQNLLVTAGDKAVLQAEAAANSARWKALKADCDAFYPRIVQNLAPNMADSNYSEFNSNGPFPYGSTQIKGGYEGGDLNNTILPLAACYLATAGNPGFTDQARAAAYGAKAKDILMSVSRPTAWMARSMPVANIVVSNGTATVASAHGVNNAPGVFFTIAVTGTGNALLDTRQRAVTVSGSSFTFPTTAAAGTYTPTALDFLIGTDGESGCNAVGRPFSIGQIVKGATTRLNTISGSAYRVGQQVRVWGLQAPYDVLNGVWTAAAGTLNAVLMIPVNTSGLTTTTTIPLGAYSAPIEEAFAVTAVTAGTATTLTVSGAAFTVGQNVRVWGLAAPYDVLNGTWTAAAGSAGTSLKISYDSSALANGTIPSLTAFAGDLTRLKLNAQTINGIRIGDLFRVSGVRGCTIANDTWKIAALTKPLTVTYPDGRTAPALQGECSYDAPRQSPDAGYHLRNLLPLLATGYDWLAPLLNSAEKQAVVDKMVETFWVATDGAIYPNLVHPMHNYYTSTITGFILADVAMGSALPQWLRDWIEDRTRAMTSYYNIWLSNGGYPQGLRDYGNTELGHLYRAALAKYKAGVDWRAAPYNFAWLNGTLQYMIGTVAPDGVQGDDYGYVSTLGGVQTSQDTRVSAEATLAIAAWANAVGHESAPRFSRFHRETLANVKAAAASGILPGYTNAYQAGVRSVPGWDFVLEHDWNESAWTPTALTYYGYSGDFAISRTAWNDPNAVYLTLQGNIFVDYAAQGKQKMKLGEITIRRGGAKRLVMTADGAVARTNSKAAIDDLHNTNAYSNQGIAKYNRFYNGLWASATTLGGGQYYQNWCIAGAVRGTNPDLTDRTRIPSYEASVTSVRDDSRPRLTHKVDRTSFSYWKAENLECYYTYSATQVAPTTDHKNHVLSWKREAVLLRPSGVAVVRDVSKVRFDADDRFINWIVPKGGSVADVPGGKQFTVSNTLLGGDIGAITFLQPDGLQVNQVDCIKSDQKTSYNACDRLEVRPAANDHTDDVFYTILDPSGDLGALHSAALLPSTNGTAMEIGTDALVAFASETLPMTYTLATINQRDHVIIGLTPGVTYKAITGSSTITITTTGTLGQSLVADSAGTISFQFGLDPAQPHIFTSSLPDAVQNTAYTATLTAVSGTPPYQWSVVSGTLPAGFSLQANGAITGTPGQAGLFPFRLRVQDATAKTEEADLTIKVQAPVQTVQITTASLADGQENQSYEQLLAVSGGTLPLQWSVTSGGECLGGLGLNLDQGGRIHGKPQASGVCDLAIRVVDAGQFSASRQYQLLVHGVVPLMTASAMTGSSSAVIAFGYTGLNREQGCEVNALNGAAIQASASSASGYSRRSVLLSGLQPDTPYRVSAYCGNAGLTQSLSFRTRPVQAGASSITINLSPPARVGARQAMVQYGIQGLTSTISEDCAEKCKVVLSGLSSGALYQYRWQWTGGKGTPAGSIRYFVAP
ncbi:Ig domain-containing protein [Paludibaculum fermentans]|uniref:Ig domain-containing protein n=1 Tax=Paludibaculum fermentans TaxID=1473598 RepID=UPI003EB8E4A1